MAYAKAPRAVVARPELKTVTLYLNRAELTHRGSVTLPAGTSTVVVRGLSELANKETLEISFGAGAELVAAGGEVDGLAPAATSSAQDSLNRATAEQARVKAELAALQEERQFWLANRTVPAGTQAGWSTELQKGAALLRTRLVANQLEINRLSTRNDLLTLEIGQLNARLQNDNGQPATDDLVLTVRAPQAGAVPLTVHYFTGSPADAVFWEPQLDIRSDETGKELRFVKQGRIYNQTELDWRRVNVTLVDQLLETQVTRPTLLPWALGFDGTESQGEGRLDAFVVKGTAAGRPTEARQSNRHELSEPLSLARKAGRTISLSAVKLPGRPEFLAVPKLSAKAFRQTKVTGWEGLQLPEEAGVFYRGAYVGRTALNADAYNDSLELSLGLDDRLVINRAKLEDVTSTVALSGNRRVRLVYELNVRNLHPETVRVRVLDQIPVASDKAIDVKPLNLSGAQLDERTGKLTWMLNLAPNANQRLQFGFEVEYPKDRAVNIMQRRRRISVPKTR